MSVVSNANDQQIIDAFRVWQRTAHDPNAMSYRFVIHKELGVSYKRIKEVIEAYKMAEISRRGDLLDKDNPTLQNMIVAHASQMAEGIKTWFANELEQQKIIHADELESSLKVSQHLASEVEALSHKEETLTLTLEETRKQRDHYNEQLNEALSNASKQANSIQVLEDKLKEARENKLDANKTIEVLQTNLFSMQEAHRKMLEDAEDRYRDLQSTITEQQHDRERLSKLIVELEKSLLLRQGETEKHLDEINMLRHESKNDKAAISMLQQTIETMKSSSGSEREGFLVSIGRLESEISVLQRSLEQQRELIERLHRGVETQG